MGSDICHGDTVLVGSEPVPGLDSAGRISLYIKDIAPIPLEQGTKLSGACIPVSSRILQAPGRGCIHGTHSEIG